MTLGLRKCNKCQTRLLFAFFSLVLWVFSFDFPAGWCYHYQFYCLLLSGLHVERLLWSFLNFLTTLTLVYTNTTSWLNVFLSLYYREPSKFTRKSLPVLPPYSIQPFLWQTQWVKNTQRLRCNLGGNLSWQKNHCEYCRK